ncbi:hypothetical protein FGO68_gene10490 [Halteria grandinella]|uniref:C2H2-type domain-containing protein n=1 Tax=Halteria grandinella TaxID=5974 RepID=A0A8J8P0V9_HALGN|nr:hypothetical protein FGO68_gene10490 [Halteria grandinella]
MSRATNQYNNDFEIPGFLNKTLPMPHQLFNPLCTQAKQCGIKRSCNMRPFLEIGSQSTSYQRSSQNRTSREPEGFLDLDINNIKRDNLLQPSSNYISNTAGNQKIEHGEQRQNKQVDQLQGIGLVGCLEITRQLGCKTFKPIDQENSKNYDHLLGQHFAHERGNNACTQFCAQYPLTTLPENAQNLSYQQYNLGYQNSNSAAIPSIYLLNDRAQMINMAPMADQMQPRSEQDQINFKISTSAQNPSHVVYLIHALPLQNFSGLNMQCIPMHQSSSMQIISENASQATSSSKIATKMSYHTSSAIDFAQKVISPESTKVSISHNQSQSPAQYGSNREENKLSSPSSKQLFQIGNYDASIDVKLSMVNLSSDIIGKIKTILHLPDQAEVECFEGDYINATNKCRTHVPDSNEYLVIRYARQTSGRLTNAFMCTFEGCSKIFPKWHNLFDHLRIHTGEKPFKCPVKGCIAAFNQTANQKKHIETHKFGNTLLCGNCGFAFQRAHIYNHFLQCSKMPHSNLKIQQRMAIMSNNQQKYSNQSFQGLNENIMLKIKANLDRAQTAEQY